MVTAVTTSDDAVFGALDVAGGYASFDETALAVGKTAAISFGTSLAGSAIGGMGPVGEAVGGSAAGEASSSFFQDGLKGVMIDRLGNETIANTLTTGLQMTTNNAISSGVTAFGAGGEFWNAGLFGESMFGQNALAGDASGMTGTAVSGGLGSWSTTTSAGTQLTGQSGAFSVNAFQDFSRLAGNSAQIGMEYALTGGATMNVLNTSMFHRLGFQDANSNPVNSGLFEVHFGNDGSTGKLGAGGTGIDITKLASSLQGLGQTARVTQLKLGGTQGNTEL